MIVKHHWNYFIALENDLSKLSRYVEFDERNFPAFSIELAHILFAASSEIDVLAKLLCEEIDPTKPHNNIDDYRKVLRIRVPEIANMQVEIPRYGLEFTPWSEWNSDKNPAWWKAYNNVKHHRNSNFDEATLENAMLSMSGLLVFVFHYYQYSLSDIKSTPLSPKKTNYELEPDSSLIRLKGDYYPSMLVVN